MILNIIQKNSQLQEEKSPTQEREYATEKFERWTKSNAKSR